jgi:hypothetical protein
LVGSFPFEIITVMFSSLWEKKLNISDMVSLKDKTVINPIPINIPNKISEYIALFFFDATIIDL